MRLFFFFTDNYGRNDWKYKKLCIMISVRKINVE
jgi:hypothetical protein